MAAKFKIGEEVEQIVTAPIKGVIQTRSIDGDDDIFLVAWTETDADDEVHEMSRWFKEDEIVTIPPVDPVDDGTE
jgi:hypothetical protein